jgi:hypothetical protein
MVKMVVPLLIVLVLMWSTDSSARRTYLTPEQKNRLSRIQTILVAALALTEKGSVSPNPILKAVQEQFEGLGFQVVTDAEQLHDVEFHVICEERKRQQGVTRYGGDAELPDTPDRLWHGPACQLSYRLDGRDLGWHKEVHGSLDQTRLMTGEPRSSNAETSAFDHLAQELTRHDFPVLLLSEWGHTQQLVDLLTASDTPPARQLLILDLFRQFPSSEVLPHLLTFIQEGRYLQEAIGALSGLGREVVPHLLHLFESQDKEEPIRAAAAKGLGRILQTDGDPEILEVLLKYLENAVSGISSSTDIEFPVLTEVVWAIGSIHHKPTFHLIGALQDRVWTLYDTSPEMKKLRDVVSVVYRFMDFTQL